MENPENPIQNWMIGMACLDGYPTYLTRYLDIPHHWQVLQLEASKQQFQTLGFPFSLSTEHAHARAQPGEIHGAPWLTGWGAQVDFTWELPSGYVKIENGHSNSEFSRSKYFKIVISIVMSG